MTYSPHKTILSIYFNETQNKLIEQYVMLDLTEVSTVVEFKNHREYGLSVSQKASFANMYDGRAFLFLVPFEKMAYLVKEAKENDNFNFVTFKKN